MLHLDLQSLPVTNFLMGCPKRRETRSRNNNTP